MPVIAALGPSRNPFTMAPRQMAVRLMDMSIESAYYSERKGKIEEAYGLIPVDWMMSIPSRSYLSDKCS